MSLRLSPYSCCTTARIIRNRHLIDHAERRWCGPRPIAKPVYCMRPGGLSQRTSDLSPDRYRRWSSGLRLSGSFPAPGSRIRFRTGPFRQSGRGKLLLSAGSPRARHSCHRIERHPPGMQHEHSRSLPRWGYCKVLVVYSFGHITLHEAISSLCQCELSLHRNPIFLSLLFLLPGRC